MANKKVITSAVAVAAASAMLLGGTLAWQSTNQTALNEASDVINPGGRLHDDFNGENKDVYVENFADENIYARIRLDEYFEIITNYNPNNPDDPAMKTTVITEGATKLAKDTYVAHKFGKANATDDYWTWYTGGSTVYMPTFNLNKDSLEADINGEYLYEEGAITNRDGNQYSEMVVYGVDDPEDGTEIYDADANDIDEVADGTAVLDENYKEVAATHYAKDTLGATLISMDEWMNDYNSEPGEYWVYDTDGWVYWAQAIEPDTATGLLLDGIELNQVMDDTWYYAINVVAQFITADDLGKTDNTGFYDTEKGSVPSDNALALLEAIGVDVGGEEGEDELETVNVNLFEGEENYQTYDVKIGQAFKLDKPGWPVISLDEDTAVNWDDDNVSIRSTDEDGCYTIAFIAEDLVGTTLEVKVYEQDEDYTTTAIYGAYLNILPADSEEGDLNNGFTIYSENLDESTAYANGATVELSEADVYTLFLSYGGAGKYYGENKDSYTWSVNPDTLAITTSSANNDGEEENPGWYVSASFSLDDTVPNGTYTFTATNSADESENRTAVIEWTGAGEGGETGGDVLTMNVNMQEASIEERIYPDVTITSDDPDFSYEHNKDFEYISIKFYMDEDRTQEADPEDIRYDGSDCSYCIYKPGTYYYTATYTNGDLSASCEGVVEYYLPDVKFELGAVYDSDYITYDESSNTYTMIKTGSGNGGTSKIEFTLTGTLDDETVEVTVWGNEKMDENLYERDTSFDGSSATGFTYYNDMSGNRVCELVQGGNGPDDTLAGENLYHVTLYPTDSSFSVDFVYHYDGIEYETVTVNFKVDIAE